MREEQRLTAKKQLKQDILTEKLIVHVVTVDAGLSIKGEFFIS